MQINDTLQGQVANLQKDNSSFQVRVTALQETTTSLSAQISALARQAQSAACATHQLQVRQPTLCHHNNSVQCAKLPKKIRTINWRLRG